MLTVLLDGFDEIADRSGSEHSLPSARRAATGLVSRFIAEMRGRGGILVTGRENYFDSVKELRDALGIRNDDLVVALDDFNEAEAAEFLKSFKIGTGLPEWLPRRPLLLAYLAHKGLVGSLGDFQDASEAWDSLVHQICTREAAQIEFNLAPEEIRSVLEALADRSRASADELGSVSEIDVREAYRNRKGEAPDSHLLPLLMRLPGLTSRNSTGGDRQFLDVNLLNVLRAMSVPRFIENPHSDPSAQEWKQGLSPLGVAVAVRRSSEIESSSPLSIVAAGRAAHKWRCPTLALDVMQVALRLHSAAGYRCVDFEGLSVEHGFVGKLDWLDVVPQGVKLREVEIRELHLASTQLSDVSIDSCIIERLVGISESDRPTWINDCEIGQYVAPTIDGSFLKNDSHPLGQRVALVILERLYVQGGGGRLERAFSGGLNAEAQALIPKILSLLEREKLAVRSNRTGDQIWLRVPSQRHRVSEILRRPANNSDPLFVQARSARV